MKKTIYTLIILLLIPAPANANLEFDEGISYASFVETDPNKVFQTATKAVQSNKCDSKNSTVFACTASRRDYTWFSENISEKKCEISSFEFLTTIEYIIPDWENVDEMPSSVQKKWRKYEDMAISHEEIHGDIIKKHSKDAYRKILNLKTDCKKIGSEVKRIMQKAKSKMSADHRRLDARSGNMKNVSVLK